MKEENGEVKIVLFRRKKRKKTQESKEKLQYCLLWKK